MVKIVRHILLFLTLVFAFHCNFEKQININLPDYPNTPYIECYLEPGQPYRLIAYYSLDYFGTLVPTPVRDAQISITHRGTTVTLPYDSIPRYGELRYYNYKTNDTIVVPAHYNEAFTLSIVLDGVTYSSATVIPVPVAMDSIFIDCNSDLRCEVSMRFKDPQGKGDYYRYLTFADSLGGDVKQDFSFSDELYDTEEIQVQGRHDFNEGEKGIFYLYHMTKDHYDFLSSVKDAQEANGNPFAQPSSIKSNIPGLLGIFSGLTSDQKTINNVE